MSKGEKGIRLKVAESLKDDAYKGIARIDIRILDDLGVKKGDVISITGSKMTVAIADRAYPADVGEGIIRMDGVLRKNAGVSLGEEVVVDQVEVKEAKKITIAPVQKGVMVQGDPESLKKGLLARTLVKGDSFVLGGVQRRRDLMDGEFNDLNDLFGNMGNIGDLFGGMLGPLGGSGVTQLKFVVVSTNPGGAVIVTENTEVSMNSKSVDLVDDKIPLINYEDIGGLDNEIKKVREMVEIPMKHPEIFNRLGVTPPKGVLLHGPPGTGKTLLAKAVANETDSHFILVNGPEIHNALLGGSEKKIREVFEQAEKNAPSIIFIDEIDAIAPKREESHGEVERRVVSQLLTMMDGINSRGRVIVIGATNRPNSIDPALRRPGRFDREIIIGVPSKIGRLETLKIHSRGMPLHKNVDLESLASKTHGFVGADLEALTKEAAMNVLRKNLDKIKSDDDNIPMDVIEKLVIKQEDFESALKVVRPSAMREVLVETPTVGWNDVGGLDSVKRDLKEAVEWPMKHPESFKRMGIRPSRGVLLYGPPGTGKTLMAKAVAKESEANFIQVKGPSLLSMWVGKSEEGVRKIFEKAREVSPCIIFFDEIDAIAGRRGTDQNKVTERVLNQLLSEMDGIEDMKDVLVVAATNRPDMIDPALLRPGRFDKILLVNAPTEEGRLRILKIHTMNMPLARGISLQDLAKETEGFTGADLEALTREAAMIALREDLDAKTVKKKHFDSAREKVKPSVTKQSIEIYKKIEEQFLNNAKAAMAQSGGSYLG